MKKENVELLKAVRKQIGVVLEKEAPNLPVSRYIALENIEDSLDQILEEEEDSDEV